MNTQEILEATEQLTNEQREILIGLLQKRQIEIRREEIAQHAKRAITACQTGQLVTETADELIKRLRHSLSQKE